MRKYEEEKYPLITVITVSYNSVKTIEQTISSVVNQTYPWIEYIIIDGGSQDGTIDVIKKYEQKIFYWISEPDKGIYHAMNKGTDIARGDYIHFLNSDDCFSDYKIVSNICEILQKNKDIDILCANVWLVDEKSKQQRTSFNTKFNEKMIYEGGMPPHQGMIVRADIQKKYHFNEMYKMMSDHYFFLEVYFLKKYKFEFIEKSIVFFSSAGSSYKNIDLSLREQADIMQHFNLSPVAIRQKRNKIKRRFLHNIKRKLENYILKKIEVKIKKIMSIMRLYKNKKKVEQHTCNLKKCRWCGRNE